MSQISSLTIVSAFIGGINFREDRKINDYIILGNQLLNVPLPKLIFIDRKTFKEHFINKCLPYYHSSSTKYLYESLEYPTTHFLPISIEDMYLFKDYLNQKTENFNIITKNPKKDTIEFIMVQCMKTEWVKQAIEIDIYNTSQFAWIDFGAFHFVKDNDVFKNGLLLQMSSKIHDTKVRIPCGKPANYPYFSKNVYHHVIWLFVGSLFGGGKKPLLEFAELVKEKCIQILEKKHHLMWEINVWYLVFFENIHLFDRYIAEHNYNMLYNY